jgi:hypothetical protein
MSKARTLLVGLCGALGIIIVVPCLAMLQVMFITGMPRSGGKDSPMMGWLDLGFYLVVLSLGVLMTLPALRLIVQSARRGAR